MDAQRVTATYPKVDSETPAFERVPARRRPDSEGLFVMPASLKDELALLCLPDLEKLLGWGGSKRRENILVHYYHERRLPWLLLVSTRIDSEAPMSCGVGPELRGRRGDEYRRAV